MGPALLLLSLAGAAPHHAALDYARADSAQACPDATAIQRAVVERLGYSPWTEEPEIILNAVVSGGPGAYQSHVAMVDTHGEVVGQRDLASAAMDCEELAAALVLDLCMAIDPQAAMRPVVPPSPPTRPPRRRRQQASPPPPSPTGVRWAYSGWAHALASWGSTPGVATGMGVGASMRWGILQAGVEARLLPPTMVPVRGGRVGAALTTASFLPCARLGWVATCASATAGSLVVVGEGLENARTAVKPYAALGTRLELDVPLPWRLSLRTGVDASLALLRVRVTDTITGDTFWAMPPGSFTFFIGLGSGWPWP